MITIKEIAKKLNMSPTTVSNVIHGKTGEVSPETTERVRRFLEEVEYVPNISARNLAQNQSKIIGVVLKAQEYKYSNIFTDPFVAEMIGGIEKAVRALGYFTMVYISDDIAEILKYVSTWNVDGLLLYCMLDDDAVRVRKKYRKPIVCIDSYISRETEEALEEPFVNVGLEDEQGAYEIVRFLLERGHRRIAFLSDNREGVDLRRFRGYRKALEEYGVEYSDRNFFLLRPRNDELEESLSRLVRKAGDYTAVFCCSDLYAVRMINACERAGIRVPEDLSVAGFDDNFCGRLSRPGLTTMHQDAEYKGKIAAETLIRIIRGEDPGERRIILKPRLVVRESVADLRNGGAE